jgi:hypothetical protein
MSGCEEAKHHSTNTNEYLAYCTDRKHPFFISHPTLAG